MSEGRGKADYFQLRMNDFAAPNQHLDAFPSVQHDLPLTYLPDTITLKYPVGSDVTFIVGDRSIYVNAGDILFIAPYLTYSEHHMQPSGKIYNIVIRPSQIKNVLPHIFETDTPVRFFLEQCSEKNGPAFLHLQATQSSIGEEFFTEFVEYCIGSKEHDQYELLMWELRFEYILLRIISDAGNYTFHSGSSLPQSDILSLVIGYVQRNLSTATLEDAANSLGWNTPALSRYIKKQTGQNFSSIIQVLKLDEAAALLRSTQLPVEDIMVKVGYTGKAHFYDIFASRFGETPAKYRKWIKKRQRSINVEK